MKSSLPIWCVNREPDSTYFELPPGSQPGERPVPSTSTPGSHRAAAESSMDVFHLRDINDNVMVRCFSFCPTLSVHFFLKQCPCHCLQWGPLQSFNRVHFYVVPDAWTWTWMWLKNRLLGMRNNCVLSHNTHDLDNKKLTIYNDNNYHKNIFPMWKTNKQTKNRAPSSYLCQYLCHFYNWAIWKSKEKKTQFHLFILYPPVWKWFPLIALLSFAFSLFLPFSLCVPAEPLGTVCVSVCVCVRVCIEHRDAGV